MGSCGSSLNCNKCYASEPIEGCDTEIDINPDIAGIGVLAAFLFSAIGISAVVVWGYFQGFLPPDVLTSTDHYALQSLEKRRRPFTEANLAFHPSPKQKNRTEVVTGFIKVLSDQQLITGVAILIAGLASRCHISIYEFNIVTYLAYFAEFTHCLSLSVLRKYLFDHKLVRDCRVVLTIGFLIIFAFSFIINTASVYFEEVIEPTTLNVGNVLQCIFDGPKFGKWVQFDPVDSSIFLGLILAIHIAAVVSLYFEPGTNPISELVRSFWIGYLRTHGFSKDNASIIMIKAELKYDAWFHPSPSCLGKTNISDWFLLDEYYGSIILAVWFGGLKPANGLQIMGFGQIVAIGLLALTLLAAVEIVNEQRVAEVRASIKATGSDREMHELGDGPTSKISRRSPIPGADHSLSTRHPANPDNRILRSLIRFGVRKPQKVLDTIRAGIISTPAIDILTAKKMGNFALLWCFIESCILTFVGIGWNIL
ncbi:hypothetical protein BDW02DRAFT_649764 [Decorospora gaudefroyi]|uniref:Uncharacterized protein n=1 Tax=Decorospora gaudefroyi TaxID=184978 RepID=A0A6A5K9B0_9PLEO|nr:hypothetical protein BDW02DRAFT_649764 [Decorospora gaudefroyi]